MNLESPAHTLGQIRLNIMTLLASIGFCSLTSYRPWRSATIHSNRKLISCCVQQSPKGCSQSRRVFLTSLVAVAFSPSLFPKSSKALESTQNLSPTTSPNTGPTGSDSNDSASSVSKNSVRTVQGYQTESGITFVEFDPGQGRTPKWGDLVFIQYKLYTVAPSKMELVEHDSTYRKYKKGYLVHHGNGEHILGLEEVLHTMREGAKRRCVIPSRMAYFQTGFAPIPPSQRARKRMFEAINGGDGTIVMDVEVIAIEEDPEDRGYYSDLVPTDEEVLEMMKTLKEDNPDPTLKSIKI